MLGLGILAVPFVIGFLYWRAAIPAFLVWTLGEGMLRKWTFLDWQRQILFMGPMMVLGGYARYVTGRILRRDTFQAKSALTIVISFYFVFVLLQAFNENLPSPQMGLVAVFVHFMFLPIAYMLPATFGSVRRLARFMLPYVFLSVPLVAIACLQFVSPLNSVINRLMYEDVLMPTALQFVRASATFTFPAAYGHYLDFIVIMAVFLISLRPGKLRSLLLGFVCAASLFGVLLTATRANILSTWASLFVLVVAAMLFDRRRRRTYALLGTGTAALFALAVLGTRIGDDAWHTFFLRLTESGDTADRFLLAWTPFRVLPYAGFGGHGTGITYGGSVSLAPRPVSYPMLIHYEPERMLYELGPGGFILVYLVRFLFMGKAIQVFLRSRSLEHRLLSLGVVLFQAPVLFLGQMIYEHSMSRWWWFMAGLIFLIEREQKALAGQEPAGAVLRGSWPANWGRTSTSGRGP